MAYSRPNGLLAGFRADLPDPAVPALHHVGEQWAPRDFVVPPHRHEVWEFYLQVHGESRWSGPDGLYTLEAGNFLAVAPGVPHQMHERPRGKHHFFFAAIDLPALLIENAGLNELWRQKSVVFEQRAESLLAPFRQLTREVLLDLPHRSLGLRLALENLILEASRLLQTERQPSAFLISHPCVLQAKELLDHQPGERWRLADLSRRVGLSRQHLLELFCAEVGMTPRAYLLDIRVQRAKEMLAHSDLPVTDLALEMGFSSSQHFASAFKRRCQLTPNEYRKKTR